MLASYRTAAALSTKVSGSAVRALSRRGLSRFAAGRGATEQGTFASTPGLFATSAAVLLGAAALATVSPSILSTEKTLLAAPVPGGDVIQTGTPVKEKATGILFPQLCNGFYLAGTGVRVKWGMIKVYAVGTYLDSLAMNGVKGGSQQAMEDALLNPDYPRTIRIVMARGLSIDTFMNAIVESLEPRMKGEDLDKLEEFKKLNAPVDLVKGAVIEMTIRGETLLYKDAVGNVGSLHSRRFTTALCDTYYGKDCVSPTLKQSVLEGIPKL